MQMQAQLGNSAAPGRRSEIYNQVVNQSRGLMTRPAADQYRSIWSGTVANSSSTVSSQEGNTSARTTVSPELLQQKIEANSSSNPRFSAHDRYCKLCW